MSLPLLLILGLIQLDDCLFSRLTNIMGGNSGNSKSDQKHQSGLSELPL